MLKPSYRNVIIYLFLKYLVFFLILALANNRFKSLVIDNATSTHGIIINAAYYLLYVFIFMSILTFIFSAPVYYAFKVKNAIYFILIIIGFLVVEYLVYTYLASQTNLMNGVYNGIISLLILIIIFFKNISLMFSQKRY